VTGATQASTRVIGTAFSPTDVMPLASRAKLTIAAQSLIPFAVVGPIIARAVDILT
jgi:hypothetical protein